MLIRHVPWDVFDSLLIRSVRLYYDSKSGDLVAKLSPSAQQNDVPSILSECIRAKTMEMGIDRFKLRSTATTRYYGTNSAKEGDAGFRPMPERRRIDDWPTFVIESGVSESLARLRIDAGW